MQISGAIFSPYSHIAIDDIELQNSPCPQPGSCDFDEGLCGFSNLIGQGLDDFDWVLEVEETYYGTANGYITARTDLGR